MRADLWRNTDGSSLLEAALILPILVLLVFGIVEFSLYAWQLNLANKAVQLGLRKAIVSDSVAVGPGLTRSLSATYWDGLPPGARCDADGPGICPSFSVQCDLRDGCRCGSGGCGFSLSSANLSPIYRAMHAVLPQLKIEDVRVGYATNRLGYVGRPVPVPVDVSVSIVGMSYAVSFLGDLVGSSWPIRAAGTMPSEDLTRLDPDALLTR